jgi:hypothetical protein
MAGDGGRRCIADALWCVARDDTGAACRSTRVICITRAKVRRINGLA